MTAPITPRIHHSLITLTLTILTKTAPTTSMTTSTAGTTVALIYCKERPYKAARRFLSHFNRSNCPNCLGRMSSLPLPSAFAAASSFCRCNSGCYRMPGAFRPRTMQEATVALLLAVRLRWRERPELGALSQAHSLGVYHHYCSHCHQQRNLQDTATRSATRSARPCYVAA